MNLGQERVSRQEWGNTLHVIIQEEILLKLQNIKAKCSVIVNFSIPIDSYTPGHKSKVTPEFLEGERVKDLFQVTTYKIRKYKQVLSNWLTFYLTFEDSRNTWALAPALTLFSMVESRKTSQTTVYIVFLFLNYGYDQVPPKWTKIMRGKKSNLASQGSTVYFPFARHL